MELSSIFLLSSLIFVILFLKLTTGKSTSLVKLPPGPRKLPLIGHLHLLVSSDPAHHVFKDLALKYGPDLMHLKLGEVSTIIVSSSEMAKELFRTHDITFAYRPSSFSAETFSYNFTDIGLAPYGEYWRQVRKLCTLELLSTNRVQSFRPIREEEFYNLCRWIASKEGSLINLSEKVNLTTYDIIMRTSLGKKTGEAAAFISIMKETNELSFGFHIVDLYPSIKLFRWTSGLGRKIEAIHQKSDRILENIISNHKAKAIDDSTDREDLIDVLLKFHADAGGEISLTNNNLKGILLDMFTGGSETSSTTVNWVMAELLKNPRIMEKVKEEVRRVYDEQGYVDESFLHELKYLKLVIKEGLRLHPPLPLLIPRENRYEKIITGGYEIPLKTRLMVNAWAIGRDPKNWKEPERFFPERFLENPPDFNGNSFQYLPFGAGRRICPGMVFGLANVELPLAMLLYHFDWTLPQGLKPEELTMAETLGMVSARKDHLHLIPTVRKPLLIKENK
uniref:Cytochrome P450 CYP71D489 n=1 Tax=Scoparia dulcis TaxID=107240 RepID=A0A140IKA0_SCODU|nr:cytochrome P450 CYP71D489 [Scoparia dulcis]